MRVLLVQPDMTYQKHHPLVFKGFAATIPLGIAYMAAFLEDAGHEVRVVDYQIQQIDITAVLSHFQPKLVGISICSPAVPHARQLIQMTREMLPAVHIVAGGAHVTSYPKEILTEIPQIDLSVVGEGELILIELVDRLQSGQSIDDVKGIVYRKNGEMIDNGPGPVVKDLKTLPQMPLHLFAVNKYFPLPGTFQRLPSVAMATSRGCPFKCRFCNSRNIWNNKIRMRPPLLVVDEIEELVGRYGIREVYFVDELFTANQSNVVTFCEELLKRKIRIGWKCCSRVDTVDREMLALMKKSGCFLISYGVESGDDRLLKTMKKGITTDQVREAFRITRQEGIFRMAFFILNSYGETKASIRKTLALSREIEPDFVNYELFKPFPDIEMRKDIEKDPNCRINWDLWNDWNEFTVGNHVFYTQNDLDEAYLKRVYEKAVKGFYLRPQFILRRLIHLKSIDQLISYTKTFANMLTVKALDG